MRLFESDNLMLHSLRSPGGEVDELLGKLADGYILAFRPIGNWLTASARYLHW